MPLGLKACTNNVVDICDSLRNLKIIILPLQIERNKALPGAGWQNNNSPELQ